MSTSICASKPNCINPDLYAAPEEYNEQPDRCIAPTLSGARCTARTRVAPMCFEAEAHRDEVFAEFLLLHCCTRHRHRDKLRADRGGCLDKLVSKYSDYSRNNTIANISIGLQSSACETEEIPEKDETVGRRSSEAINVPLRSASGRLHRSGARTGPQQESSTASDYFEVTATKPRDNVRDMLFRDLSPSSKGKPTKNVDDGAVYSFIWPMHPNYAKIGYTNSTASGRMIDWAKCHPGSQLSKEARFPFASRMERLVHLEMSQWRRRIPLCNRCSRSHIEWFELPIDTVDRIIDEWSEVVDKEPLYADGKLTQRWVDRLRSSQGNITARRLLDILDTETSSETVGAEVRTDGVETSSAVHASTSASTTTARTSSSLRRLVETKPPPTSISSDVLEGVLVPSVNPVDLISAYQQAKTLVELLGPLISQLGHLETIARTEQTVMPSALIPC